MDYLFIRHTVKDAGTWRPAFDDHRPVREAAGLKDLFVCASQENPNDISILFAASDLRKARELVYSDEVREVMKKAGVIGEPEILLLTELPVGVHA